MTFRKLIAGALLGSVLLANAPVRKHVVKSPRSKPVVSRPVVPLSPADAFLAKNARLHGVRRTASGLQYRILKPGTGAARPTDSDVALISYVGTLTNGTEFDRSRQPTPMPVAGVVPGFAESLKLMRKGATYRVWIKPEPGLWRGRCRADSAGIGTGVRDRTDRFHVRRATSRAAAGARGGRSRGADRSAGLGDLAVR